MTHFALLISFVDHPEAFASKLSEDSINLIKEKCSEHEEPLKEFNDIIYSLDSEEYLIISNSVQRACYIAFCKRINDYLKYLKPEDITLTNNYMTLVYQQCINTLLQLETVPESRITNYITKNF